MGWDRTIQIGQGSHCINLVKSFPKHKKLSLPIAPTNIQDVINLETIKYFNGQHSGGGGGGGWDTGWSGIVNCGANYCSCTSLRTPSLFCGEVCLDLCSRQPKGAGILAVGGIELLSKFSEGLVLVQPPVRPVIELDEKAALLQSETPVLLRRTDRPAPHHDVWPLACSQIEHNVHMAQPLLIPAHVEADAD